MELKPIKEKNETLYPTIKEVPKSNYMKEMLLVTTITPGQIMTEAVPCYVATVSYFVPVIEPVKIFKIIRSVAILITILSSILLIINKMKINKCTTENEIKENLKKSNKHRKIKWWIYVSISIAIIVITSIVIYYLENYM